MNAYLFTAVTTRSQVRQDRGIYGAPETLQIWDSSASLIVLDDSPESAQKRFEEWTRIVPEGENPVGVRFRKIAAAQFVDQLFTESGHTPLNWQKIAKQADAQLQSTPLDDFEQGYWVDVNQIVRPDTLSFSPGTLQSDVPEDIRLGLNWAADKKFLFVLSVLSPLAPPAEPAEESETNKSDFAESSDENAEESGIVGLGELCQQFPEALDKESAVLIEARNSVIAAWLWRRYAVSAQLPTNSIRIDPWCGVIGLDGTD